jgi:hypothetical protein
MQKPLPMLLQQRLPQMQKPLPMLLQQRLPQMQKLLPQRRLNILRLRIHKFLATTKIAQAVSIREK